MKHIDDMIEKVYDEIDGAMDYAEKSITCRAKGNMTRSNQYREMAQQELNHATILRDYLVQDVDAIKKVHKLTDEEETEWEHHLKRFAEKIASVKILLS